MAKNHMMALTNLCDVSPLSADLSPALFWLDASLASLLPSGQLLEESPWHDFWDRWTSSLQIFKKTISLFTIRSLFRYIINLNSAESDGDFLCCTPLNLFLSQWTYRSLLSQHPIPPHCFPPLIPQKHPRAQSDCRACREAKLTTYHCADIQGALEEKKGDATPHRLCSLFFSGTLKCCGARWWCCGSTNSVSVFISVFDMTGLNYTGYTQIHFSSLTRSPSSTGLTTPPAQCWRGFLCKGALAQIVVQILYGQVQFLRDRHWRVSDYERGKKKIHMILLHVHGSFQ